MSILSARTRAAFKYDVKFQVRHGFYHAYLLLTVLYILGLTLVPDAYKRFVTALVIFTDPSVLGFFFIGGIVLLEKGQNTLESLFVTPLRVHEYLLAKVGSLTLLALASSLAIAFFSLGFDFNVVLLVLAAALTSVLFTLLGIALAARAKSLNQYFLYSLPTAVLFLPFLKYLGLWDTWLFYLFPVTPALLLLQGALFGVSLVEVLYAVAALSIWIAVAYRWAYRWFFTYTVLGMDGGRK